MTARSRRISPRACALAGLVALFGFSALAEPASRPGAKDETNAFPLTRAGSVTTTGPADALLDAVVTWLAANFDLPAIYDHPRVEFANPKKLAALRFGAQGLHAEDRIVAVYVDAQRTIFLPENWSSRTPAEQSVLVHELVHHLQNLDKRIYNCAAEREKLAYDAQEKWLNQFGRSLESEFQIDPFTRLVATRCL